ncbi:hypothetical protein [Parachitinimonas caeni]|uniref:Type II toxin-antitoxin system RelE/ParE family toxin n=1 Tax=Parachitinimonas caeni TaxID=3031301 RepID=A0ABT7DYV9_9NEIS|nr:hypothetical protein [Parachitinimonas caeni]MDK2124253.1 hypothetical protein [Parachitinimonas caeni]
MVFLVSWGSAHANAGLREPEAPAGCNIEQAARTHRELRHQPGHFDGASRHDAVDRWNGPLHSAMQCLAKAFGQGGQDILRLRQLMGPVDKIINAQDAQVRPLKDGFAPNARQFWIYHWRGEHDYLVFAIRQRSVLAVRWYYAGE